MGPGLRFKSRIFRIEERTPAGGIRASQGTFSSLKICSQLLKILGFNFHWHEKIIQSLLSDISSLLPSSVAALPGQCWTWSETQKTCFLMTWLISYEPRCEKTGPGFPTRSDTNRAVQPQKMARGLKFCV